MIPDSSPGDSGPRTWRLRVPCPHRPRLPPTGRPAARQDGHCFGRASSASGVSARQALIQMSLWTTLDLLLLFFTMLRSLRWMKHSVFIRRFFCRPFLPGDHHGLERPQPSCVMSRLRPRIRYPERKIGPTGSYNVGGNTSSLTPRILSVAGSSGKSSDALSGVSRSAPSPSLMSALATSSKSRNSGPLYCVHVQCDGLLISSRMSIRWFSEFAATRAADRFGHRTR